MRPRWRNGSACPRCATRDETARGGDATRQRRLEQPVAQPLPAHRRRQRLRQRVPQGRAAVEREEEGRRFDARERQEGSGRQRVRAQRRPPHSLDDDHAGAGRGRVLGRLRRGNGEIGVSERLAGRRQAHTCGLQPFSPARSVAENRRPLDRAWQEEACVDAGERLAQRRTSSYSSSYWRAIACALKLSISASPCCLAQRRCPSRVVEQRAHGPASAVGIVRGHEQAGLAVGDRLRDAADVGGHDRAAREHRLDEGER